MNIIPSFASPLVTTKLNCNHEKISDWCNNQTSDDTGKILLNFEETALQNLYSKIKENVNILHEYIGLKKTFKQILHNGWVNCYDNIRTQSAHCHPEATFICVYYPLAENNSSPLVLTNPNNAQQYVFPSSPNEDNCVEDYNIFTSNKWAIRPETDLLVIFPSWVQHGVESFSSKTKRISIAINTRMVKL